MKRTMGLFFGMFFAVAMVVVPTNAQTVRGVSEYQVRTLLQRLETRTDTFRSTMDTRLDNSRMNNTRQEDRISDYISSFENATDNLRNNFNARRATDSDVTAVLTNGWYIDEFMRRNRLGARSEREWRNIRSDLNSLSRYYGVAWNWNQTLPPFTPYNPSSGPVFSQAEMRALLTRLETNTDNFRMTLDRRLDNSRWNNTNTEDSVSMYVAEFENATDDLRNNFNMNRATASDATEVLNNGWYIDRFMRQNRLGAQVETQWRDIRTDLDTLARSYSVSWNWMQTTPPFPADRWSMNRFDSRITGTYRLNTALSDNVEMAITRALSGNVADRQRQNLERRLMSPENLAIQMRGNEVTVATNLAQPVSFTADGRVDTETNRRGATTKTTVTKVGNTLTVSTEGDRANDFWVTFTPVGRDRLRVTRKVYLEGRNELISVTSVYDRTSNVATWPPVDRRPNWNNTGSAGNGDFFIPNGTKITAVLRDRIVSNVSQVGDRFTMEITSPQRYRGAMITGRVIDANSSGRISGRANIGLDFDSVSMNGRTYSFSGIIDSARENDGDVINVSNEGTVRDSNQTKKTVTRAGIGALLGAVIGAVAGGGDGAAIGAGIGAGAGAGSVLIQGRDNINLESGSEFTITATGPTNMVGYRP